MATWRDAFAGENVRDRHARHRLNPAVAAAAGRGMCGMPPALATLAFLACSCGPAALPPKKGNPQQPLAAVSFTAANGSNALARVAALCSYGPRDAGTPGCERAAQWLAGELRRDGLQPRIDTFTNDTPSGPLTCHNVLATVPGSHSAECETGTPEAGVKTEEADAWIVLLSHFDTKSGISTNFIGANDGGSSTGLLLELAQVLHRSPLRRCGVIFGFVDGEECRVEFGPRDGLHGSRRLAAQCVADKRPIRAVILLDMIGDRDLSVTLPENGSRQLTQLVFDAASKAGVRGNFRLADGGILDDHQPFLDAGYPAVDLIDFAYGSAPGRNDYWHTPEDTLDKLSDASLTAVGQVVVEMLRQLDVQ